jgi:hypothetical protein
MRGGCLFVVGAGLLLFSGFLFTLYSTLKDPKCGLPATVGFLGLVTIFCAYRYATQGLETMAATGRWMAGLGIILGLTALAWGIMSGLCC